MSRKFLCVGAAITTIFLGGIVSGGDAPPADVKKENAELREQVQRLQAEVDALRARLAAATMAAEARSKLDQYAQIKAPEGAIRDRLLRRNTAPSTTQPALEPPSLETLPPGTVQQQFNGAPVYIIPLDAK